MPKRQINIGKLIMINIAMVVSLRGLPMSAEYGLSLIFFFLAATFFFLLPVSLVSAELATGWHTGRGVYTWVSEALGPRWGFLAVWLQWIQNVIWYPTVLSFTAATIAYIFSPSLSENKTYNLFMILGIYWLGTFLNFKGMNFSSWISTIGVLCGTFLPGFVIILFGFIWYFSSEPIQTTWSISALFPDFSHINHWVYLAGMMLLFAGMEVSAVHALEVKNPQKDYPKSIFLSVLLILTIFILGSLSIAVVVPKSQISLVAGILQALNIVLDSFHLKPLMPWIAALIAIGTIGQITTWIIGPSKGLYATAKMGDLPPFFQKVNDNHVPTHILYIQGIIVTIFSFIFLFMPTVSSSYWILTAMTAQLYLLMYILLYISALRLRYTQPKIIRAYRIPGGNLGMWLVVLIGLIGACFSYILGFVPPSELKSISLKYYVLFLCLGSALFIAIPLIIYAFRKSSWKSFDINS